MANKQIKKEFDEFAFNSFLQLLKDFVKLHDEYSKVKNEVEAKRNVIAESIKEFFENEMSLLEMWYVNYKFKVFISVDMKEKAIYITINLFIGNSVLEQQAFNFVFATFKKYNYEFNYVMALHDEDEQGLELQFQKRIPLRWKNGKQRGN